MPTKPGLFWLASFPKSGNTWVRFFLANLLFPQDEPDINRLHTGFIASSREWVEDALGIDIEMLSHDEVELLRPLAYQHHARELGKMRQATPLRFHKIHDAYTTVAGSEQLIPPDTTAGAVILTRNPLDIATSFASHSAISVDESIARLCDVNHQLSGGNIRHTPQLRQRLLTWSAHVESWLEADIPKIVVRYEDLIESPTPTFTEIVRFLGLTQTADEIDVAIEKSRFDRLQSQEKEIGFSEKAPNKNPFFRKGSVGEWRERLSDAQIARIISTNRPAMERLGYLNADGTPGLMSHGKSDSIKK